MIMSAAIPKPTYLILRGGGISLNGRNAGMQKTQSTMFLRNVCQWVRWMASPKQPQSISGFLMSKNRVTTVKNAIIAMVMRATILLQTPARSAAPTRASSSDRATARNLSIPIRKVRLKNLRYSRTMRVVPTGSMSLRSPDRKKTRPIRHAKRRRKPL